MCTHKIVGSPNHLATLYLSINSINCPAQNKNRNSKKFLTEKLEIQDKIKDFEQKGLSWLEPAREFVLSLNQAAKLMETENKKEMTTFFKNIGSNHILQNRRLIFEPKIPFDLAAAAGGGNPENLTFPKWCAQ